jgi:glycosyltransferase involved in cell wall biosynthesis
MTVRMQKSPDDFSLPRGDRRIDFFNGNLSSPEALYTDGDAFIQPSKLEGIGFMVLEAVASGLPVITLNYPPMNEWVHQPELLANTQYLSYPAYSSAWIEHSHLRLPSIPDLARKIRWAAENDLEMISRYNRAWAENIFARDSLIEKWQMNLEQVLNSAIGAEITQTPEPLAPCHSMVNRLRRKVCNLTGLKVPLFRSPTFSVDGSNTRIMVV